MTNSLNRIDINLIKKADLLHNQDSKNNNEESSRDTKKEAQDSFYEQEIKDKILSRSQRTDIFKWVVRVSSFYLSALFFIFMLNALEIKEVVNIITIFLMFFSLIKTKDLQLVPVLIQMKVELFYILQMVEQLGR